MALDLSLLQSMGLSEITLWLLSFSILYGILGQAEIPKSKASRMIISIVIAFFVVMSAPTQITTFLSQMTSNLVIVLIGILALLIFVEVAGVKATKMVEEVDEKGKGTGKPKYIQISIFEQYGYYFVAAFLIIAALIFANSGGLALLGWNFNLSPASTTTIIFIAILIIAVMWMVSERKEK